MDTLRKSREKRKSHRPWYRNSKGQWYVTIDGKQTSLGVHGLDNEADAWAALQRLIAGGQVQIAIPNPPAAAGTLGGPVGQPPGPPVGMSPGSSSAANVPTVAEACAAWLAEVDAGIGPQTKRMYQKMAKLLEQSAVGQRRVDAALTVSEVRETSRRETWSPSYQRTYLDVATAVLALAGWPHRLKKKPRKVSAGSECVLTEEQHAEICDQVRGDLVVLLRCQWDLGARPQEIAGLTFEKIKWADGIAVLREHKNARHGRARTLYFPPQVLTLLERQRRKYGGPAASGLVFRNMHGERFTNGAMGKVMWRASRRMGFRATGYHYRHTFITRMLLRGMTAAQVAELCGTSVEMIARHYGHLEAVRGLREVLLKAAG